jgi:hypothetical protein
MLTTIQNMKFFLSTGYGDSANYAGGESDDTEDPVKTQGMCQGNGAAPTVWMVTRLPHINARVMELTLLLPFWTSPAT